MYWQFILWLRFTYCIIFYFSHSEYQNIFQYTDRLSHTAHIYSHMLQHLYIYIT